MNAPNTLKSNVLSTVESMQGVTVPTICFDSVIASIDKLRVRAQPFSAAGYRDQLHVTYKVSPKPRRLFDVEWSTWRARPSLCRGDRLLDATACSGAVLAAEL